MLSASLTVSACQTIAYKPIICDVGTALKDGRCQKVKAPKTVKPKMTAPRQSIAAPAWTQPSAPAKPRPATTPKQNEYGQ